MLVLLDYALRSRGGHRVRLYKRCRVDVFAAYLLPDGLVCRLAEFDDLHSLFGVPLFTNDYPCRLLRVNVKSNQIYLLT